MPNEEKVPPEIEPIMWRHISNFHPGPFSSFSDGGESFEPVFVPISVPLLFAPSKSVVVGKEKQNSSSSFSSSHGVNSLAFLVSRGQEKLTEEFKPLW